MGKIQSEHNNVHVNEIIEQNTLSTLIYKTYCDILYLILPLFYIHECVKGMVNNYILKNNNNNTVYSKHSSRINK